MLMYCPRCAYEIQDSQTFCWRCGFEPEELTRIRVDAAPLPTYSQPEAQPRARNKVAAGAAAGAFASLVALGLGCVVVLVLFMVGNIRQRESVSYSNSSFNANTPTFNYPDNLNSNTNNVNLSANSPSGYTPPPAGSMSNANLSPSPPPPLTIANASFIVAAQQYVYYQFYCPSECVITGGFQAQGGRNDIQAYILDEVGFGNMQRRKRVRNYYNSGIVTADNLYVRLRSGSYYLVFDNTPALFTSKAVSAQITASF